VRAEPARVAIRTLGCKVNRSESEALAQALAGMGIGSIEGGRAPDAVVVNTCTVTGEADAKARKEVRRALADTEGPVIVTGCLAAVDAEGLHSLGGRVVVQPDRTSLAATIAALLKAGGGPGASAAWGAATSRTRALVKVQDGCDNRCSYCIVPDARGAPRSVPAAEVVARVAAVHAAGTGEVVLTGINIGRYADGAGAPDLAALVGLVAATGIRRIRISSIEPPDLTDHLLGVLAGTPAVAPHLHVPLQSGCDRTLVAMGRRYGASAYADGLTRARSALPGLAVTTDVMAGFPGESDEDFASSFALVEACGFARLHVFRYSRRAGTAAASAPGQVPAKVSSGRAASLRALSTRLERARELSRAGGRAELLVESVRDGVAHGTTEDYLRIAADLPGARAGDLVAVELAASVGGGLRGYYGDGERARSLPRAEPHTKE
jgi:threonylcarbamoyladenosine tRNA methylthiotransferase MtaB